MKKISFLLSACVFSCAAAMTLQANQSAAVTAGDFLYVSAQFPIAPLTGQIGTGDTQTLTNLVLDQIQHLLHVKGYTMKQVVKTEVYLTDIRNFESMDSAYGLRFPFEFPPARDVIEVSSLLNNSPISISCIADSSR